jgi:predicted MFS family arabinose efflux permease
MQSVSLVTPLKNKRYALILSGQFLSDFGNWFDYIALNTILVYSWGLGPEAVAAFVFAVGAPWILFGPLLGVWMDRLPSKPVLVISDLLRGLLVLGLFFAPNLWVVLPLVFLKSTVAVCFEPARIRAIRQVIEPESLSRAISLSQISVYLTKIIAPSIGGLIATAVSPSSVFLIEVGLFLVSACLLSFLPKDLMKVTSPGTSENAGFLSELKGGFQHLRTNKNLLHAVVLISSALFLVFLFEGLFSLWTNEQGLSEQAFGLLISAVGLGSFLGAIGGGQWEFWKRKPLLFISASTAFTGCLIVFIGAGGLSDVQLPLAVWLVVALLAGTSAAFSTVPFAYLLQAETPPELIGRISGTSNALQNVSTLLAPMSGAFFAGFFSISTVFLGAGLGLVLLGTAYLLNQVLRPAPVKVPEKSREYAGHGM